MLNRRTLLGLIGTVSGALLIGGCKTTVGGSDLSSDEWSPYSGGPYGGRNPYAGNPYGNSHPYGGSPYSPYGSWRPYGGTNPYHSSNDDFEGRTKDLASLSSSDSFHENLRCTSFERLTNFKG